MSLSKSLSDRDRDTASAFDQQAERFERAPVQTDPAALARLLEVADLPPGSLVLDAGCGPGLVAEQLLEAGHRVVGFDLSTEMIGRAKVRCSRFGDRGVFLVGSIHDEGPSAFAPFDASISRYVLHHVPDPMQFAARQVALLRPGGVLVLSDHSTDPEPGARAWHQRIECLRDRSHTSNATPGELVDLLVSRGMGAVQLVEEAFSLDFDEWFDRGTPGASKDEVRRLLRPGESARGFRPILAEGGRIRLDCWRAIVRGVKPDVA